MKISVIVPVYNVEKYLEACVDSLYQQDMDHSEYEVILVNDGSTDSSCNIAMRLEREYSNIRLIDQENQGLSCARNTGINNAKGEYLMFVDSDDFIASNSLKILYETAVKQDCDILFFGLSLVFGDGRIEFCRNFPKVKRMQVYSGIEFFKRIDDYGGSVKALYKKSFIHSNSIRFTLRISREDCDFGLRIYPIANRVVVTDIPVYYYRKFGESLTRTKNIEKLRYNLFSEFFVIKNVLDFIKDRNLSTNNLKVYKHKLNSMFVGTFLTLIRKKNEYGNIFYKKCISFCLENNLISLFEKTNSWRTTIILQFINVYLLMYKFIAICKNRKSVSTNSLIMKKITD